MTHGEATTLRDPSSSSLPLERGQWGGAGYRVLPRLLLCILPLGLPCQGLQRPFLSGLAVKGILELLPGQKWRMITLVRAARGTGSGLHLKSETGAFSARVQCAPALLSCTGVAAPHTYSSFRHGSHTCRQMPSPPPPPRLPPAGLQLCSRSSSCTPSHVCPFPEFTITEARER